MTVLLLLPGSELCEQQFHGSMGGKSNKFRNRSSGHCSPQRLYLDPKDLKVQTHSVA